MTEQDIKKLKATLVLLGAHQECRFRAYPALGAPVEKIHPLEGIRGQQWTFEIDGRFIFAVVIVHSYVDEYYVRVRHFGEYAFNDYTDVDEAIDFIANKIAGERSNA